MESTAPPNTVSSANLLKTPSAPTSKSFGKSLKKWKIKENWKIKVHHRLRKTNQTQKAQAFHAFFNLFFLNVIHLDILTRKKNKRKHHSDVHYRWENVLRASTEINSRILKGAVLVSQYFSEYSGEQERSTGLKRVIQSITFRVSQYQSITYRGRQPAKL